MAEREEDMIIGPSPNLGSLFAGLSRTIAGVQDKRREKREKIQSEANETFRTMSNFELGQNKSFQEVATKGLYGIKNDLLLKNKQLEQQEITSEQYKLFKNNAEDSYRAFTNASKSYDKIIALYDKEKAEGKTGDGSALKMQYFAQNADMNGVEYYTGLDGTGYKIKRDKQGNIIDKQNVKNLSNPSNLRAETVSVAESVEKVAKTWKGNTRVDPKTGVVTTDIAKGKEALFDSSRASLMHQLTNTPEKAYSVLADNGGGELTEYKYFQDYEGYFNEEQKQKLIKERLDEAKIAMSNGYSKYIGDDANGIAQYEPVEGREMTKEEEEQFIKDQEKFLIKWKPDGSNNLVIDTDDPSWQNALQEARNIVGRAVDMTISSKQTRGYKTNTSSGNITPKKQVEESDYLQAKIIDDFLKGDASTRQKIINENAISPDKIIVNPKDGRLGIVNKDLSGYRRKIYAPSGSEPNWEKFNGVEKYVTLNGPGLARYFISGGDFAKKYKKQLDLYKKSLTTGGNAR